MSDDFKDECEQEIKANAHNKGVWEQLLPMLRKEGAAPSEELIRQVEDHINGLEASSERLRNFIKNYEAWQNAHRT